MFKRWSLQVQYHMLVMLALGSALRRVRVQDQPHRHKQLKASVGYLGPCLKKTETNERNRIGLCAHGG